MAETTIKQAKRIAIVQEVFPPEMGGVAAAHYHLFRILKKAGHEVSVFTYGVSEGNDGKDGAVTNRGSPQWLRMVVSFTARSLFRVIDHSKIAYQSAATWQAALGAWRLNGPLRRFRPDILIVPDHGCPGLMLRPILGCLTIHVCHHNPARFLDEPLFGAHSQKDAAVAMWMEQRSLAKIDRVICPSHYMKSVFYKSYRFGGPVSVIPNVVDLEELDRLESTDLRQDLGLPSDTTVVYIPSAGSKYKGTRFVPEIIRRLTARADRPIVFFLSGDIGNQTRHELSYVTENARLFMPGRVTPTKNLAYAKTCSFAVSPTLIENFSMGFLEATMCGLPVVTFDVGGNSELIIDGENGFLAPYLNIEQLIGQAERLLDATFLTKMRKKTRMFSRQKFDSSHAVTQWAAQWAELV